MSPGCRPEFFYSKHRPLLSGEESSLKIDYDLCLLMPFFPINWYTIFRGRKLRRIQHIIKILFCLRLEEQSSTAWRNII